MNHHDDHDDFGGLDRDLRATREAISRRGLLRAAASLGFGLGALPIVSCGSTAVSPSSTAGAAQGTTATGGACATIPEETAGPYPADSSNGPSVLNQAGIVRSDIRPSFAGLGGEADGVPLSIALTLVSATTCAPLDARAVYLWHCDRLGRYSLYSSGVTSQNYLRGVQETDGGGQVSFTSIFPACYSGRWPHIHFEVFASLAAATQVGNKIATSQIALPKAACDAVYATAGYESSVTNLARVTLATDMVFSDGSALELATVTGSVAAGFTCALTIAV